MGKICMNCGTILYKEAVKCKYCNSNNIDTFNSSATMGDYFILRKISKDPKFIKAMLELHDKDIIEYELKMSQFRNQVNKAEVVEDKNVPHCPTCNSTNLTKISTAGKAVKIGLFGIFGAGDLGKTWKCNNCGSKF